MQVSGGQLALPPTFTNKYSTIMELLDKILDNVRNGAVTNQLAKQQVLDLFGVSNRFNTEQIQRISKMLSDVSHSAFIQGGGTESEYKDWWNKRNKVNLNGC